MPTLTIKHIPTDLLQRLRQAAAANNRSITDEVIVCLEKALGTHRRPPGEILTRARQLRKKTINHPITNDSLTQSKITGRP